MATTARDDKSARMGRGQAQAYLETLLRVSGRESNPEWAAYWQTHRPVRRQKSPNDTISGRRREAEQIAAYMRLIRGNQSRGRVS